MALLHTGLYAGFHPVDDSKEYAAMTLGGRVSENSPCRQPLGPTDSVHSSSAADLVRLMCHRNDNVVATHWISPPESNSTFRLHIVWIDLALIGVQAVCSSANYEVNLPAILVSPVEDVIIQVPETERIQNQMLP